MENIALSFKRQDNQGEHMKKWITGFFGDLRTIWREFRKEIDDANATETVNTVSDERRKPGEAFGPDYSYTKISNQHRINNGWKFP